MARDSAATENAAEGWDLVEKGDSHKGNAQGDKDGFELGHTKVPLRAVNLT